MGVLVGDGDDDDDDDDGDDGDDDDVVGNHIVITVTKKILPTLKISFLVFPSTTISTRPSSTLIFLPSLRITIKDPPL